MAGRSYIRKVGMNGVYNESDEFMAGQRMLFRGPQDKIPAGWLIENGAAVSRTTYATLFAVIGVAYGAGDGATTFNLPDARGEFDRGLDLGRGVDPGRTLGSSQGDAIRNITGEANHAGVATSGGFGLINTALGSASGALKKGTLFPNSVQGLANTPGAAMAFDASLVVPTAHENRPRNLAGIPIIKYS